MLSLWAGAMNIPTTPKSRRRYIKLLVFLGCIFVLSYILTSVFQIKNIHVVGDGVSLDINQNDLTQNLLFFPSERIKRDLESRYPLIENVTFRKQFPNTLTIEVTKRRPIARLSTNAQKLLIGQGGVVLGDLVLEENLSELLFDFPILRPGEEIDDSIFRFALEIIRVSPQDLFFTSITKYDASSLRAGFENTYIIFSQERSLLSSMATLQTIIAGFRIKGRMPARIDLRFDKPVVEMSL